MRLACHNRAPHVPAASTLGETLSKTRFRVYLQYTPVMIQARHSTPESALIIPACLEHLARPRGALTPPLVSARVCPASIRKFSVRRCSPVVLRKPDRDVA